MTYPRCAELDLLRNRLIEAYRNMSSTEISAIWGSNGTPADACMTEMIGALRDHKSRCILCQRNEGLKQGAAVMDQAKYEKHA